MVLPISILSPSNRHSMSLFSQRIYIPRTLLLSGFLSTARDKDHLHLVCSVLNSAERLSEAEGMWKRLLHLFPFLAERVLVGREGDPYWVLFGEGYSVGLYHSGGEPDVFRARRELRGRSLSLSSFNTSGS